MDGINFVSRQKASSVLFLFPLPPKMGGIASEIVSGTVAHNGLRIKFRIAKRSEVDRLTSTDSAAINRARTRARASGLSRPWERARRAELHNG